MELILFPGQHSAWPVGREQAGTRCGTSADTPGDAGWAPLVETVQVETRSLKTGDAD